MLINLSLLAGYPFSSWQISGPEKSPAVTNLLPRQISGPYKYPGLTNFWPNKSPGLRTLRDWKISGPDKYYDLKNFGPEKTLGLTKLWAWKTSSIPVIPCTCNFVPIATNWNQILDPQKLPSQLCPVTIATPRAMIQIVDIYYFIIQETLMGIGGCCHAFSCTCQTGRPLLWLLGQWFMSVARAKF